MVPGPGLTIPRLIWEALTADAARFAPQEACGLLAGISPVVQIHYPIPNELHSTNHFRMEPQAQVNAFVDIEARGLELLAIWHSHPAGPAYPSATDLAEYAYPGVVYLIWSPSLKETGDQASSGWTGRGFLLDRGVTCEILLKVE